jgi:outer membrane murein-binding lipoprotein Lpp
LVHAIDGSLVTGGDLYQVMGQIATQTRRVEEGSRAFMQDVPDTMVRINIGLRLWSGCLSAAKTIAHETRSGPNTPAMRRQQMETIDEIAAADAVYAAGVEAAPAFKRLRNQAYSLDGVPEGSRVRRDA